MKLLDKLKNALFEEEYVEVEEKPIRKERKKEKPRFEEIKKEKPIAKKIVQEDKKEEDVDLLSTKEEHLGESLAYQPKEDENEFKFPMVSDNEFKTDDYLKEEPKKEKKIKKQKEEQPLYQGKKNHNSKPYGLDNLDLQEHEYGAYERKEERTYFKPSPIISPIYGILDKNYTKEDIIPKKEIRLTSSYSRENINVDDVRKKAFGTLENDIEREIESSEVYDDIEEEETSSFLDLSSDNKTPEVSKVTMGDAEEYFEDLGLEYNVDYKDTSKEKASGRRSEKEYENSKLDSDDINIDDDSIELNEEPQIIESKPQQEVKILDSNEANEDNDDDDNLFDLIDSMYDKE